MKKWQINNRTQVFKRPIFSIDELDCFHPEKHVSHKFTVMNTPDWINIVALTTDKKIIMVKQHRLGTDEFTYETPAGVIESGEPPLDAAKRELLEETGYTSPSIELIQCAKANPAIMTTDIYFFLAKDCRQTHGQQLDTTEDIEVHLFNHEEILEKVKTGKISHSIILTALSLFFLKDREN